jgi:hypothetical protein
MDQGVTASMKRHYQADLLKTLAKEDSIIALWKRMGWMLLYSVSWAWSVNPVMLV